MARSAGWTRRGLLAATLMAAGAALGRLSWRLERPPDATRFHQMLLAAAPTRALSPELGVQYLDTRQRADAALLTGEILERLGEERRWGLRLLPLDGEDLDRRLDEAIRRDFTRFDGICVLHGWYMSQTECRLAALKHLAAS